MTGDPVSRVSDEPIDNALGPRLPFPTDADESSQTAAPRLPRSLYDNGDRFGAGHPGRRPNARPKRPPASRCRPSLWDAASILSLAVALVCLALIPPFGGKLAADPEPSSLTAATAGPSLPTIPIERIRPGNWALAHNPGLTDEERLAAEHDDFGPVEAPDDWRLVLLRMDKPDGGDLQIELLRPVDWLDWYEVRVGAEIDLDLEELGADGPATVLAIHGCPQILPRPGPGYQLVTGRFAHSSAEVLDLVLIDAQGQRTAIGVTASHPFWSEDQQAFVPAGDLTPGTRLQTATGDPIQVATITPRSDRQAVFNIEVDVEHAYYVSEVGVLVHNTCHKRPGRLGGPKHRQKVLNVIADIKARYKHRNIEIKQEYYVKTPHGRKPYRFMDVAVLDAKTKQPLEVHQIGRGFKRNTRIPVIREREALQDVRHILGNQSVKRFFHAY